MTYWTKSPATRVARTVVVMVALASVAACKGLDVPDYNASSLNDLRSNPTSAAVAAAATGVLHGNRLQNNLPVISYLEFVSMVGRETYTLDPSFSAEPARRLERNESTTPSSNWDRLYRNIQQENILLSIVDNVPDMTAAEKEALKGFLKTIQAFDLLLIINQYDDAGAIIDVKSEPAGPLAAFVSKQATFDRIVQLLDQGKTHLAAGGTRFTFPLGNGFADFNTPAKFLQVNRALRARVAVYRADHAGALQALSESFINNNPATLALGAYHAYSTNSGDLTNPFYDPLPRIIYAHPSFRAQAQNKPDGTPDNRMLAKVTPILPVIANRTQLTYRVDDRPIVVNSASAPLTIIRNEELILLRAEANLGLGNTSLAIADLNLVRVNAGGLAPLPDPYVGTTAVPTLLDALLYEKRYSLYFEGHRWVDMRRYGKLAELPKDRAAHRVFPRFILGDGECVPRNREPIGCTVPAGF